MGQHAGHQLEQLARHMRPGPAAGRGHIELVWIGLGVGQIGNSPALPEDNSIHRHHDRRHALLGKRSKSIIDFPRVACLDRYERKADLLSGVFRIVQDGGVGLGIWIPEKSNAGNIRHNCRQQFQLLGR